MTNSLCVKRYVAKKGSDSDPLIININKRADRQKDRQTDPDQVQPQCPPFGNRTGRIFYTKNYATDTLLVSIHRAAFQQ